MTQVLIEKQNSVVTICHSYSTNEAISIDQLQMTSHVTCKMTELYFEDGQPVDIKPYITSEQSGNCF